jgi:WD40 repeat protein
VNNVLSHVPQSIRTMAVARVTSTAIYEATRIAGSQSDKVTTLLAQARAEADPKRALALVVEAADLANSSEVAATLQLAVQRADPNIIRTDEGYVSSATWSPDGNYLLVSSGNHLRTYAINSSRASDPTRHDELVTSAAWASQSNLVLTTSANGTLRIWDMTSFLNGGTKATFVMARYLAPGRSAGAAWSPTDTRIVAAGVGAIVVWQSPDKTWTEASSSELRRIRTPGAFSRAAWCPDGNYFVSAGPEGRIWNSTTGDPLPDAEFGSLNSAAWSPNSDQVVVAYEREGGPYIAQIWNVSQDGAQEGPILSGHGARVNDAMWSPTGERVVTASEDGTARIWSASDGTLLETLEGHQGTVIAATWSPDGKRIVTGGVDGTVRIYYIDFQDLLRKAKEILAQLGG